MALPTDNVSMALYCDFENVALGVRDAKYNKFDIKPVLERLLLKGSIVLKKAYCDWDRYKEFKPQMHEASFELIEIPHVRQSGKNSADIRLVVDALDLCYTKSHVNTFVIISGDSDFSPLVSKLRENAKYVIGVGVKNSSSDLLIANCDEFIFVDDLLRESRRTSAAKRESRQNRPAAAATAREEALPKEDIEVRKAQAIDIAVDTFDALMVERGDVGKIWASALKQAIKRRKPDFNETNFGFKTFGNLLEDAQQRGLIDIGRDDKSGAYVYRGNSGKPAQDASIQERTAPNANEQASNEAESNEAARSYEPAMNGGEKPVSQTDSAASDSQPAIIPSVQETTPSEEVKTAVKKAPSNKRNASRRRPAKAEANSAKEQSDLAASNKIEPVAAIEGEAAIQPLSTETLPAARKTTRTRRPRKPAAAPSDE